MGWTPGKGRDREVERRNRGGEKDKGWGTHRGRTMGGGPGKQRCRERKVERRRDQTRKKAREWGSLD